MRRKAGGRTMEASQERKEMGAHAHARRLFDTGWSRVYWLDHCEGFHVEGPRGRVGVVEGVGRGGDGQPTSLMVRYGLLRRRVREVPVDEIAELDPRDLLIVLRQEKEES